MKAGFSLTRTFSITSLLGIVTIVVALGLFYRWVSIDNLKAQATRANSELAQAISNTLRENVNSLLDYEDQGGAHISLADSLLVKEIDAAVLPRLQGLSVIKIKIFDLHGHTIYSTDHSQIGKDESQGLGVRQALLGVKADKMSFREHFIGINGSVSNRHVVASYIPIRSSSAEGEEGPVEGVFEIYTDVTPLVKGVEQTALQVLGIVALLMLALYLYLLDTIRRADRELQAHGRREREEREQRIHYLAKHDPLTGLPNRNQFNDLLDQAVARAERSGNALGVMLIGLDRFKVINDSLGQEVGDRVLVEAAEWLGNSIYSGVVIARLGGDEFAIIMENLLAPEEASLWAKQVLEYFESPMVVEGREVVVSPSIGIALWPGDGEDTRQLLDSATAALHQAKETGRRRYVYYTNDLNSRALERLDLEMDLRKALEQGEFELFYQPRVDVESGRVAGMEALLRWIHPQRGMVSPAHIIPMLEETGMIVEIGEWILREACRQCQLWHEVGYENLRVSVNLSLEQLRDGGMIEAVASALSESGLPASALELELTESTLAEDNLQVGTLLQWLKAMGVQISLDDFGTGYSSLSYLMHYPIDHLKIDRSFVSDIVSNREHEALTRAIILMGHSIGIKVVAEGVEQREQLELLRELECDEIQGFYYSRPQPAEKFLATVDAIEQGWSGGEAEGLPVTV